MTEAVKEYGNYINSCWLKDVAIDEKLTYDAFQRKPKGSLLIFDKSYCSSWSKMEKERKGKERKGKERKEELEKSLRDFFRRRRDKFSKLGIL